MRLAGLSSARIMFSLIDKFILVFRYYDTKLGNMQVGYYASKENLIGYLTLVRHTYLGTLKCLMYLLSYNGFIFFVIDDIDDRQ